VKPVHEVDEDIEAHRAWLRKYVSQGAFLYAGAKVPRSGGIIVVQDIDRARLDAIIADAIASTGAATIKDMGKVMGVVKSKAAGKADMGAVGARIKAKLGG
jgi:uncharacterized protein YciI